MPADERPKDDKTSSTDVLVSSDEIRRTGQLVCIIEDEVTADQNAAIQSGEKRRFPGAGYPQVTGRGTFVNRRWGGFDRS